MKSHDPLVTDEERWNAKARIVGLSPGFGDPFYGKTAAKKRFVDVAQIQRMGMSPLSPNQGIASTTDTE